MAKRRRSEAHSLRTEFAYKLATAREFRAEPAIFYPHNVDFRGRAYPIHPHLQHLGACRVARPPRRARRSALRRRVWWWGGRVQRPPPPALRRRLPRAARR